MEKARKHPFIGEKVRDLEEGLLSERAKIFQGGTFFMSVVWIQNHKSIAMQTSKEEKGGESDAIRK